MSHDQNFKNLILDCPHQALAFFAVTEADAVGTARITPVRQEQFQERLGECFCEEEESDACRFSSRPKGTPKRTQAALPRLAMSNFPARGALPGRVWRGSESAK